MAQKRPGKSVNPRSSNISRHRFVAPQGLDPPMKATRRGVEARAEERQRACAPPIRLETAHGDAGRVLLP